VGVAVPSLWSASDGMMLSVSPAKRSNVSASSINDVALVKAVRTCSRRANCAISFESSSDIVCGTDSEIRRVSLRSESPEQLYIVKKIMSCFLALDV